MNAKAKRSKPASYPQHQAYRGGCKVAWRYYTSEADAKLAAVAARLEARLKARQGYDFGYQSPGTVTFMNDGSEYTSMWEVCVP